MRDRTGALPVKKVHSPRGRLAAWGLTCWLGLLSPFAHGEPPPATLKVLLLKDSPPLTSRDAQGALVGFNVDLGRLLCDALKQPCEFLEAEQAKVIDLVASGAVDIGMVSLIVTPERAQRVLFTDPYRLSKTFWISRGPIAPSPRARVAVVAGSLQHRWAAQRSADQGWSLVTVGVNTELNRALRDGRADAVISPSSTALDIMKDKELAQAGFTASVIESPEFDGPVAVAVSPGNKALCERLNEALKLIKNNGQLDRINSKYYPFRVF